MNKLKLLSCNDKGELKFTYNDHVITSNVKKIFKWKSGTLISTTEIKKEIDDELYKYLNLINKGGRRASTRK